MKNYVKLGIAILGFLIFMASAYILYENLRKDYKPQQNLVVEQNNSNQENNIGNPEVTVENSSAEESESMSDGENMPPATEAVAEHAKDTEIIMAMDFKMTNSAGEEVSLFDFKGKPMVLNFWASWCGPCKAEIPDFQAAYEQYGDHVQFIMLNMTDGYQETVDTAKKFIEEEGYSLPFYFDTQQMQGAYTYGVNSLPTTFFINEEGEMVAYATGMIDGETLSYGISMIDSASQE